MPDVQVRHLKWSLCFIRNTIICMHENALYLKFRSPMNRFIVCLGPTHARQNQENSIRDVMDEVTRQQLFYEVHAHWWPFALFKQMVFFWINKCQECLAYLMSHDGAFDFSGSASVVCLSWKLHCIDSRATKKKSNSLASDINRRLVTHKRSMDVTHIYIVIKPAVWDIHRPTAARSQWATGDRCVPGYFLFCSPLPGHKWDVADLCGWCVEDIGASLHGSDSVLYWPVHAAWRIW